MMKLLKQAQRHKVAKAQRNKNIKNSVSVCLSAFVPNRKGFSFMELMVVVAIMGLLIAASTPLFRSFTRGRNINNGTTMVMSALRKTREAAITYRENYRTVLDTLNNAVAIYKDNDVDNPAENWTKLPDFVGFDDSSSPPWDVDRSYTADIFYLEFKPNGSVSLLNTPLTDTIAIIETSTGDTKHIEVNGLTGRIKVE